MKRNEPYRKPRRLRPDDSGGGNEPRPLRPREDGAEQDTGTRPAEARPDDGPPRRLYGSHNAGYREPERLRPPSDARYRRPTGDTKAPDRLQSPGAAYKQTDRTAADRPEMRTARRVPREYPANAQAAKRQTSRSTGPAPIRVRRVNVSSGQPSGKRPFWQYLLMVLGVLVVLLVIVSSIYINHLLDRLRFEDEVTETEPHIFHTTDTFNFIVETESNDDYESESESESGETQEADPSYRPSDTTVPTGPVDGSDPVQDPDAPIVPDPNQPEPQPTETQDPAEVSEAAGRVEDHYNTHYPPVKGNVESVLLIGVDSRNNSIYGRSDAMILASANHDRQRVVLSSFLRDSLVKIPGHGFSRLGHANAYGGPNLLMQTVRDNFKVPVSKYVLVNFESMEQIVDALGGIDLYITEAELPHVQHNIRDQNNIYGHPREEKVLKQAGYVHVNGRQAVAYARIRKLGTDFARTQRQRNVLQAMLDAFMEMNLPSLLNFSEQVFPLFTTNLSKGEIVDMVMRSQTILGYTRKEFRLPIDGSYESKDFYGPYMLVYDYERNVEALRRAIYGK